jgi:hypothetical protein
MVFVLRNAMFSVYRLECDICGISAARQMILNLIRKNLHFIFTEKSDRAIAYPELEPHKRLHFTYIASISTQIYLSWKDFLSHCVMPRQNSDA